tara:strand:+ start:204 stop:1184 length:981 start_codon:yes stop_codon:yes gene_type:complete
MKICFVDKTNFQYDSNSLYSEKLRGAESVIINLSTALSKIGHKITVINNCPNSSIINGINWLNIKSKIKIENFDVVIANGDCNLFKFAKSKKYILFSHSIQSLEKFIRKRQMFSYIKYKPKICFLSKYHKINRTKLLYIFGEINLRWSVDEIFLNTKILNKIDNKLAIFTSRPDRNLKMLIDIWEKFIIPKKKDLKLLVTNDNSEYKDKSIKKRDLGDQRNLIKDLQSSRIALIPGHKAELYCLAAEEAKELCVPIVTFGIGSLSERVEHEKSGLIAKNALEFAEYTFELFNNYNLWKSIRNNLISQRGKNTWNKVAEELINQIKI